MAHRKSKRGSRRKTPPQLTMSHVLVKPTKAVTNASSSLREQLVNIFRKSWAIGAVIISGGAIAITYFSTFAALVLHPDVDLRTYPNGTLAPFSISNSSTWLTFRHVTPDCKVPWSLWRMSGNIFALNLSSPSPKKKDIMLAPHQRINFVCDVDRIMSPPRSHKANDEPINTTLLESQIVVEVKYDIEWGPFHFSQIYESGRFCGLQKEDGIRWLTGDTIAPLGEESEQVDRNSFYKSYLARCFSPEEVDRLIGLARDYSLDGKTEFRVPAHGPFEQAP